jgi:hypothetical protein
MGHKQQAASRPGVMAQPGRPVLRSLVEFVVPQFIEEELDSLRIVQFNFGVDGTHGGLAVA